MRERVRNVTVAWWPVIYKCLLWMLIAMLTDIAPKLEAIDKTKLAEMIWIDWVKIGVGVILQGLLAVRLYTDQSLARHKQKLKDDETKFFVATKSSTNQPVP
jgi:hypothetical protein